MNETDITVYTKPACVQCNATKRHLDKAGVEYLTVDISQDADAFDYVTRDLGHRAAPVVVANIRGVKIDWSGFNPDMLNEAIASVTDKRYGKNA